jgi:hypothetical protein
LGQTGRFALPDQRDAGPDWGKRGATMAMIVLSSPTTLTGAEEKKTGPSRFRPLFSSVTVDDRHQPMIGTTDPIIQKPEVRVSFAREQQSKAKEQ